MLTHEPAAIPLYIYRMNNENQTNIERNEQNFISMLKTCWSYLLTYWQCSYYR